MGGGVEEEQAKCPRKGILQILEGQKNDSPGQRAWNGDNSTALSYSRLGPLILQDLQATVQCVPVFVCLQALQDTRGPESLASNPSGVLVPTFSAPPIPTCILVLITSRGVFPKTLAAPAMAPKTPVISGFIGLLGLSPGLEYSCSQNTRVGQRGELRGGEEPRVGPRKAPLPFQSESLLCLEWVSGPQVYLGTSCEVRS